MFSIFWLFVGFLTGLTISAVFTPPIRDIPQLPTPDSDRLLHTGTGCVKFTTTEVPCGKDSTSLNFIASQHK
jgi:hypothetical protein